MGNLFSVFFLLFLASTDPCLFIRCLIFEFAACSFVGFFSWNYTRYMWVILFFLGFRVVNAVNDAIIIYWHLLHSSLSGETASWKSTLEKKKIGRLFSGHPGCYPGNIRLCLQ